MAARQRLPNRLYVETFDLTVAGLPYPCSVGRFADCRLAEVFLSNTKSNSAADTAARDAAIALCRDSRGRASGPLGRALDQLAEESARAPAPRSTTSRPGSQPYSRPIIR
jgi:hypothetical protein